MDRSHTALLALLGTLAAACSAPQYVSIPEKDSAQISFTSMGDRFPDLELRLRGKTFSIGRDMVDIAKSPSPNKKLFAIPANEDLLLSYETSQISTDIVIPVMKNQVTAYANTIPVTGQTTPTIGHQIDFENQYKINLCSTSAAFTPAKNKIYEAFIEQSDSLVCRINIREVINAGGNTHNTYQRLKTATPVS